MKQEPKILHSDLTNDWYLVTSYEALDEGGKLFRAKKKICITNQLINAGLINETPKQ